MSAYGLCDGVNDCGDKSDESLDNCRKLTVNKCSFEPTLPSAACIWTQELDPGSTSQWNVMNSLQMNNDENMLRMAGPMFDHTYRLTNE